MIWMWWVACATEPDWVAGCDCPEGEICVAGGVAECLAPPDECGAAFDGTCDLAAVDDPCTAAICGLALGDSGLVGSTSIEAECWDTDGVVERHFDCDAPLTF